VTVDKAVAPGEQTGPQAAVTATAALPVSPARWLRAVIRTSRPRQWPKNLLVFAAPLAGASLGRNNGIGYAVLAMLAFGCASAAVYFVNDVMDAERDRQHPAKRFRAVASGRLPKAHALAMAALGILVSLAVGFWIREPRLSAVIGAYLAFSVLYSAKLKHVPVVELVFVAAGFVLRALGGAIATHVPPSAWFLLVCSLGALMVAIAKRYTELAALDGNAARHRPVMRWYTPAKLRLSQRVVAGAMILAYLLWATAERDSWMAGWHLASAVALSLALVRFDQLTGNAQGRPVEDLISRDRQMNVCELAWLIMFAVGL
jgi:decaprenyl-phosphate phosphoribosyltransferase